MDYSYFINEYMEKNQNINSIEIKINENPKNIIIPEHIKRVKLELHRKCSLNFLPNHLEQIIIKNSSYCGSLRKIKQKMNNLKHFSYDSSINNIVLPTKTIEDLTVFTLDNIVNINELENLHTLYIISNYNCYDSINYLPLNLKVLFCSYNLIKNMKNKPVLLQEIIILENITNNEKETIDKIPYNCIVKTFIEYVNERNIETKKIISESKKKREEIDLYLKETQENI